jgi:hypothetical protein
MKYYYCDNTKKLIPLDTIINSSMLPISVKKISEKISEYIDMIESTHQDINTSNQIPLIYSGQTQCENKEKIILCFVKLEKYRRGSVYIGIQISFNHKAGYDVTPFSDPYEKCNISIKVYCTDTVHHSSAAFGTTPSKKECEMAINYLKINKKVLHEHIYSTFYYFCD